MTTTSLALESNPAENHGPLMVGVCWACFGSCSFFLGLRLFIRLDYKRLWWDDLLASLGWACLLAYCIFVQLAVSKGFGKHILDINITDFRDAEIMVQYGAACLTLAVAGINTSRISFAITLIPLTFDIQRWAIYFAIATMVLTGIPLTVLPWVQCAPLIKSFVDFFPGTCINKSIIVNFGAFQGVWGALMDFTLAVLPWKILWGLQMRPIEKIGIAVAMSLGFFAGITGMVRSLYVTGLAQQDMSYDALEEITLAAAEMAMTIIATSIPILRTFVCDKITACKGFNCGLSKTSPGGNNKSGVSRWGDEAERGESFQLSRVSTKKTWSETSEFDDNESTKGIIVHTKVHVLQAFDYRSY